MARRSGGRERGARPRGRWRAEQARRVLEKLERSGLSQAEFCRREGLVPLRLTRWRQKFEAGSGAKPVVLRPVRLVDAPPALDAAQYLLLSGACACLLSLLAPGEALASHGFCGTEQAGITFVSGTVE